MTQLPDRSIAQFKKYFAGDILAWAESLPIDQDKPLQWTFDRDAVRDYAAEAVSDSPWMSYKPGSDIIITAIDGDQKHVGQFKFKRQEQPLQG